MSDLPKSTFTAQRAIAVSQVADRIEGKEHSILAPVPGAPIGTVLRQLSDWELWTDPGEGANYANAQDHPPIDERTDEMTKHIPLIIAAPMSRANNKRIDRMLKDKAAIWLRNPCGLGIIIIGGNDGLVLPKIYIDAIDRSQPLVAARLRNKSPRVRLPAFQS